MYGAGVLGGTGVVGGAALARTGFDVGLLGLLAVVMLIVGLGLVRHAATRRAATPLA